MKTTTRTHRNGSSKSAPAQAPNKPEATSPERGEITLEFLTPEDECIDCCELSAAESESVRIFTRAARVSLAEFTKDALLNRVAATKPSAPVAVAETPVVSYRNMPPLNRENVISEDRLNMEVAVYRATALMELLARQDCTVTERQPLSHSGCVGAGMMNWADDLSIALRRDFYAANEGIRGDGDKLTLVRKLNSTIDKFQALMLMLAHDISAGEYFADSKVGYEPTEEDIAPFLSLASDCIEYLKASFYREFCQHLPMDEIDRGIWNELLAKFPQAEQERRAA